MWPKMGLIRPDRTTSFPSVMLPVLTDALDPMEELRRFGIDARVAWHADLDFDALIYIPTDSENLERLARWLGSQPRCWLPAMRAGWGVRKAAPFGAAKGKF
jgi:hypothetical protein